MVWIAIGDHVGAMRRWGARGVLKIFRTMLGICLLAAALVVSAAAEARALCVTAARVNLRSGPGTTFRVTWEVNRYMPLIRIDQKGKWIKVRDVDGDTHWVHQKLVDNKFNCVTVKTRQANIRKKPTSRSEKLFTVERYTSFKRIGGQKKWVKIEYLGEPMWVHLSLVWSPST